MLKIFLDTNIFDDLFQNGPSADDISFILKLVKQQKLSAWTSPKTLMDIYYLIHSERGYLEANKRVRQIYSLVQLTTQGQAEVREALGLGWSDFEDAMQFVSATRMRVDKIITLDKKFKNKNPTLIWNPSDFRSFLIQAQL